MEVYGRLKAAAARRGLRFIVIGGHAVNLHGYARSTADLDLLICRDDRDAWVSATAELGYTVGRDGVTFLQLMPSQVAEWPLDLMLVGRDTFEEMVRAAQPMRLFGEEVLNLATVNKLDLRSDEFRHLCLRYGTPELYERILRLSPNP